jgi:hypothetical protein
MVNVDLGKIRINPIKLDCPDTDKTVTTEGIICVYNFEASLTPPTSTCAGAITTKYLI